MKSSSSVELTNEFRDYVFPIPAATASDLAQRQDGVQVRIQSSTWVPRAVLGGSDIACTWRHDRQGRDSVVFDHLQIPYRQERALVGLADAGLSAAKRLGWPRTSTRVPRHRHAESCCFGSSASATW